MVGDARKDLILVNLTNLGELWVTSDNGLKWYPKVFVS